MIQIPFETHPQGFWFADLIEFQSFAQAARDAYPGQTQEVAGAVILELEHELHCQICGESTEPQSS